MSSISKSKRHSVVEIDCPDNESCLANHMSTAYRKVTNRYSIYYVEFHLVVTSTFKRNTFVSLGINSSSKLTPSSSTSSTSSSDISEVFPPSLMSCYSIIRNYSHLLGDIRNMVHILRAFPTTSLYYLKRLRSPNTLCVIWSKHGNQSCCKSSSQASLMLPPQSVVQVILYVCANPKFTSIAVISSAIHYAVWGGGITLAPVEK